MVYQNVKYKPVGKGDAWSPESLAGALSKRDQFRSLNPEKSSDLEKIANEYIFPELLQMPEANSQNLLKGYSEAMEGYLGDYVISNLKDVVKYAGNGVAAQLALRLPTQQRKAKDGEELSEKDTKYNKAVKATQAIKDITEKLKDEKGQREFLDGLLGNLDDFTKSAILRYNQPGELIKQELSFMQNAAISAVVNYGVADYMKEALAISSAAEKEFAEKMKTVQEEVGKSMEADAQKILRETGVAPTPYETAKIREKYAPKIKEVQDSYKGRIGARQMILSQASEEDATPVLMRAVQERFEVEQAEKKAKEEAESKEKEKK